MFIQISQNDSSLADFLFLFAFRKRCEDAPHSKGLRPKSPESLVYISRQLWECARVLASLLLLSGEDQRLNPLENFVQKFQIALGSSN
ncbi:MAG: hypothetical protein DMF24_04750 [Verrucomicrobia bacterium]|nr:MAG: hypothetical protein DMF24_04750 [Verrucomicrobiota bacterium]